MLTLMWRENHLGSMSARDLDLFNKFHLLAPKYFRKFMSLATWHTTSERVTLVEMGRPPDCLYFIVSGRLFLEVADQQFEQTSSVFTGELAFLIGNKPMGTTSVEAGTVYVSWPKQELKAMLAKNEDLRNAVHKLLAREVMEKFAGSIPAKHLMKDGRLQDLFDRRVAKAE